MTFIVIVWLVWRLVDCRHLFPPEYLTGTDYVPTTLENREFWNSFFQTGKNKKYQGKTQKSETVFFSQILFINLHSCEEYQVSGNLREFSVLKLLGTLNKGFNLDLFLITFVLPLASVLGDVICNLILVRMLGSIVEKFLCITMVSASKFSRNFSRDF